MPLTTGTRLGSYVIEAPLGAGGMGEVYRAVDTKLNRPVAIKVLPDLFAADPDHLARFTREAQALAALNHPNIAHLHGLVDLPPDRLRQGYGESAGASAAAEGGSHLSALVMELVEGEDLSELIARSAGPQVFAAEGPGLPLSDALSLARQIAEALEAAHERGIIHRDLKPANIKVTPAGVVKVLDFGLAKALGAPGEAADQLNSPTLTARGTAVGTFVGTAAYMAPEQARGRAVDRRADVWAFGCVLFEMLTGRPAFRGDTITDVLAAVVKEEPDWGALPPTTPPAIRALLRKCLQKDPARRLRDMGDARLEIDEPAEAASVSPAALARPGVRTRGERLAWLVTTLVTVASLAGLFLVVLFRPRPGDVPEVRVELDTPPTPDPMSFAVSPDGTVVVFVAQQHGQPGLMLRRLSSGDAQALAGTEGATFPFWSPDGRSVAFFADSKLKRLDVSGGAIQALTAVNGARGGAWADDGTILFALVSGPIFRIPSAGGAAPAPLTRLLPRQSSHRFPHFLSDGRHFVYYGQASVEDVRGIYLASLDQPDGVHLMATASAAVPTGGDRLLFVRQGALSAQQLDVAGRKLMGDVTVVANDVAVDVPLNLAALSAARDTVMFRTGRAIGLRRLAWFDRTGTPAGFIGDPDPWAARAPELSPDGRHVALDRSVSGNTDVWTLDVERGMRTRLTFDPGADAFAVWSRDGSRIFFASSRAGVYDLYSKPATGNGAEALVLKSDRNKIPLNETPDGNFLLYRISSTGSYDLFALPVRGATPIAVATTQYDEREGQFSPDGHWVAYQSNETGTFEVYVQPFPHATARWQASQGGGVQVRWRPDGRELFYMGLDGRLFAASVSISRDGGLVTGAPVPLFNPATAGGAIPGTDRQQFTVGRDGRILAMVRPDGDSPSPIEVILNWSTSRFR